MEQFLQGFLDMHCGREKTSDVFRAKRRNSAAAYMDVGEVVQESKDTQKRQLNSASSASCKFNSAFHLLFEMHGPSMSAVFPRVVLKGTHGEPKAIASTDTDILLLPFMLETQILQSLGPGTILEQFLVTLSERDKNREKEKQK